MMLGQTLDVYPLLMLTVCICFESATALEHTTKASGGQTQAHGICFGIIYVPYNSTAKTRAMTPVHVDRLGYESLHQVWPVGGSNTYD